MKSGNLFFILACIGLLGSFSVVSAENIDLSQARQLCNEASPQQRQLAKTAGYDLDVLCSQLSNASSSSKTFEQPSLINPRARGGNENERQNELELDIPHPLSLLTPEQITALTPEQFDFLMSDYESQRFQQKAKEDIVELKPFGYDLFAGEPTTFAPATQIPVPVNYVIGPGDTIELQLFGKSSQQLSLQVNRVGQVQFPELGPINVAGLSFDEVKSLLNKRIKEQMIGVSSSISLGELRSIQVFILGEAYRPGSYTVSSLSTITNVLFVAGGVNDIGSLRNIQLKRQGKLVSSLDLYDLLLRGDTSSDARVLPGDVIYIPPVGKTVTIEGAIKRPAIYELRNERLISDLVNIAGGLSASAYKKGAQLTRVNQDGFTSVINIDSPSTSAFSLQSGDSLNISERVEESRGIVSLGGHVYRPKQMAWRQGLRVSDLVGTLSALKSMPQLGSALIVRQEPPLQKLTTLVVDLQKALKQTGSVQDLLLNPQDKLIVFGINIEREESLKTLLETLKIQADAATPSRLVSITGLVRFPGDYPLAENMSVKQLIELAGGLAESAYTLSAEVSRMSLENPEVTNVKHYNVNIAGVGTNHHADGFVLASRDLVNIRQKPEYREFATVEVKGEVKFPGSLRIKKGETLRALIQRVGGFTEYAHIEATLFTRELLKEREEKQLQELKERLKSDIANAQLEQTNVGKNANLSSLEQLSESLDTTEALGRLVIDMNSILAQQSEDVILQDGDQIVVPGYRQEVSVVGEVQYPTSHLFDPNISFEEYIERSGGETDKADDERIYIVKADGSVVLPNRSGWITATGVSIEPGDTIVVPLDVDAVNSLALWTQVSQIIYQLALGAAAITRL